LKKHIDHRIIVFALFTLFLMVGLNIYKDYGLSWDEEQRDSIGTVNYNYIMTGDSHILIDGINKYHGPIFQLLLVVIEKSLQLTDTREIYFMRHLFTFLMFFLSAVFFYLICKDRFKDWKRASIGSIFLILSPRIFADAFYNQNDIPFLSVFIISIYTLIKFHEKKTYSMAIIHALTCALLIDIRIIGIIVPAISIFLICIEYMLNLFYDCRFKVNLRSMAIFTISVMIFIILFWPILWEGPLYHFTEALKQMSKYPWQNDVLYLGNLVNAMDLPWHYIPIWVAITTPILYLLFFIIGIVVLLKSFLKNPLNFYSRQKEDIVFLLWLFIPLVFVIVRHSVLYDAWRHMFFIYPALLLISVCGLTSILNIINNKLRGKILKMTRLGLILIILFSLSNTVFTMIRYHPYQNVYFNSLAGDNMNEIKNKFEVDYWGLSYRKGLEYILDKDRRALITLNVANYPGELSQLILTSDQRGRIRYTNKIDDADYFLSNYHGHPEEYRYKNEFFSVRVDNAKILVVYKLR